jgi:hypothetical protein
MKVTLAPDGALVDTRSVSGAQQFDVLWPLLASSSWPSSDQRASALTDQYG